MTPLAPNQGPFRYMLDPVSIEVTLEEHLELLKSPRKCEALGLDNTYERLQYEHRRIWQEHLPCLPPINKDEE